MVRLFLSNKNRPTAMLFVVAALILLSSCAPYQARKKSVQFHSDGTASWYGPGFHGRKTASGERYNQRDMTAAHRTLPFGTMLKVTNIDTGKSVIVRINDRGPFVKGRIIDLSKSAAERIGMMGTGTAPVKLAALSGSGKEQADSSNKEINTELKPAGEKIARKTRHVKDRPVKKAASVNAPAGSETGNIPEDESF